MACSSGLLRHDLGSPVLPLTRIWDRQQKVYRGMAVVHFIQYHLQVIYGYGIDYHPIPDIVGNGVYLQVYMICVCRLGFNFCIEVPILHCCMIQY